MDYRASAHVLEPDRSLLIVALKDKLYALERATGVIRWTYRMSGLGPIRFAVGYGVVLASTDIEVISCLDYLTGQERWSCRTQTGGLATIVIEPDHIVCAKGGYIDCFAPNGTPLWNQPLRGGGMGVASIGYPGNVALGDRR